jgi:DNA-binding transcriptional ArsR family regulator
MPTRFVKQLVLIFRGALSIGIDRKDALKLALRCARDSIPPIRLSVLEDLAANDLDDCRVNSIAQRLRKPWTTVKRTLEALYVLELIDCIETNDEEDDKDSEDDEANYATDHKKAKRKIPRYQLASIVDLTALDPP